MRLLPWTMVLLSIVDVASACAWPSVDILFVLDSTANVGPANHELMKKFVANVVDSLDFEGADSRVAVAQFTPQARTELSLAHGISRTSILKEEIMVGSHQVSPVQGHLQNIPYEPCFSKDDEKRCLPTASINSLAREGLASAEGNRQWVPDVVVVISSALFSIPELNDNELLLHPASPMHAFFITVGGSSALYGDLQSSATNVRLSAVDFGVLDDLVAPLCESANDFVGTLRETSATSFLGGSTCLIVLIALVVGFLVLLLMMACSLYSYRKECKETKERLKKRENDIKRQYEYYRRLEERQRGGATQDVSGMGGTSGQAKPETSIVHHHYHNDHSQGRNVEAGTLNQSGTSAKRSPKKKARAGASRVSHPNRIESGADSQEGDSEAYSSDEEVSESDSIQRAVSNLPEGHPARTLPPVDLLFLVDSSSSIGLNNFETVKNFINSFLDNVDIAPGRSRVATIIFDKEPTVYFNFDRFYSHNTIKRAISKLPYRGGPTFLAKALNFAAGILWQEQNMKSGRYRKHKLMPTPKHDRLQVMVIVSDGYSEDSVAKAATQMHDRLRVKIAAVVTKSFNKERMVPITRFDGSVFTQDQKEALSLWMWRQQKLWNENYGNYIRREKSLPLSTARA
uniref:VWFA domain-containing protein n=1 Tax=Steinernema glaseri TaxID=37863 RepID=A0A1I7ZCJ7_9BILA